MSKLSRAMKKSAENLTETYLNDDGNLMAIMPDAAGHIVHTPVAFIIACKYLPNPTGCTIVGFKDGDNTNFKVDNLYWIEHNDPILKKDEDGEQV